MLWFQNLVQLIVAFVMSALATLLLQGKWKAGILISLVAAVSIVLLSVAMRVAELINRRRHR